MADDDFVQRPDSSSPIAMVIIVRRVCKKAESAAAELGLCALLQKVQIAANRRCCIFAGMRLKIAAIGLLEKNRRKKRAVNRDNPESAFAHFAFLHAHASW
ncbi:MAG: hypothetical protein IJG53_00720 [Eggerthellaceae bacterium]|nr:hypothetical protein [Eggerthellaceae bacterium]